MIDLNKLVLINNIFQIPNQEKKSPGLVKKH